MDTATYIGQQIKAIMRATSEIDAHFPDEDLVEVVIGMMTVWGSVEAEVLYSALELAFEGAEDVTDPARKRLNILHELQNSIHDGEAAEAPFSEQAGKYLDGVRYHLAADVQDILPLALQLPADVSRDLASRMAAMKTDLE